MPSTTVMWVHGHAVEVEFLFQGKLVMWRNAWSNYFLESGSQKVDYWFHVSIPTPIHNGVNPTLKKIFIEYECNRANAAVYIDKVSIFDGNTSLTGKDPFWDATDPITKITELSHLRHEWAVNLTPQPTISKGLGISICVHFAEAGGGKPERSIEFHAVGAEFQTP